MSLPNSYQQVYVQVGQGGEVSKSGWGWVFFDTVCCQQAVLACSMQLVGLLSFFFFLEVVRQICRGQWDSTQSVVGPGSMERRVSSISVWIQHPNKYQLPGKDGGIW